MFLRFLEFDRQEDGDGLSNWEALASPAARYSLELLTEVSRLLHGLAAQLGPPGPLDDGHLWDMDLQIRDEGGEAVSLDAPPQDPGRITLALSLSGRAPLWAILDNAGDRET